MPKRGVEVIVGVPRGRSSTAAFANGEALWGKYRPSRARGGNYQLRVTPSASRARAVASSGVGRWSKLVGNPNLELAGTFLRLRTVTRIAPMAVCGAVKWAPLA